MGRRLFLARLPTPPPTAPTVLGIGGTGSAVVYPNVSNAVYNPDGSSQSFVSSSGLQSQGTRGCR